MSWDSDFYGAVMGNTDFAGAITSLAFEYKKSAVAPFATYQEISAPGTNDLNGAHDNGVMRIQLNVNAKSPTEARRIARYAATGIANNLDLESKFGRSLGRDEDEELFTYAYDFLIWFDNP